MHAGRANMAFASAIVCRDPALASSTAAHRFQSRFALMPSIVVVMEPLHGRKTRMQHVTTKASVHVLARTDGAGGVARLLQAHLAT